MNIGWIVAVAMVGYILAGRFYARFLAKVMGEDEQRLTPACYINDGRDYVPTKTPIVFAHHFASIAGAGPILGPVLALIYGWGPAWLWIVFGGIFFGAVHDYLSLFISMREGGKSLALIARRSLGDYGFAMIVVFIILMLILVTATFLNVSATALTSMISPEHLGISGAQKLFREVEVEGQKLVRVGGIASMSVIIITAFGPLIGYLYLLKGIRPIYCSALAIIICGISVTLGLYYPVQLAPDHWKLALSAYTLVAAGIPVWIFLQSRDFINVHLLYVGLFLMAAGLLGASIKGVDFQFPLSNIGEASKVPGVGYLWPGIFVTIACGAISGFHSLCAGGTTCKQCNSERAARYVGYYGMLLESFLAICVVGVVLIGLGWGDYQKFQYPSLVGAKTSPNPNLTFSLAVGKALNKGLGLPITFGTLFGLLLLEGFVVTTLDTAIRLNRYLFEELWGVVFKKVPWILSHYWVNSALAVALMLVVSYSGGILVIWKAFGTANQLLAALGLLTAISWLINRGSKYLFAVIPAGFMLITTMTMLVYSLFTQYLPQKNITLIVFDLLLFLLAAGFSYLTIKKVIGLVKERRF